MRFVLGGVYNHEQNLDAAAAVFCVSCGLHLFLSLVNPKLGLKFCCCY